MNKKFIRFDLRAIGERIKSIRGRSSQAAFGKALGLSQVQVSRLESGRFKNPSLEIIFSICINNDPEINIHWLITGGGRRYIKENQGDSLVLEPIANKRVEKLIQDIVKLDEEGDAMTLGQLMGILNAKEFEE